MSRSTKLILAGLVCLIFVAHVFMWRSDMDPTMKVVFTIINFTGWTIVLAPIILVNKWMKTVEDQNAKSKQTE